MGVAAARMAHLETPRLSHRSPLAPYNPPHRSLVPPTALVSIAPHDSGGPAFRRTATVQNLARFTAQSLRRERTAATISATAESTGTPLFCEPSR